MTKYYLLKTNADNAILATDGNKSAVFDTDSNGIDPSSGIDLYSENLIDKLRTAYAEIDGLYNMDDIEMDFPDKIISAWEPDPEDELILIAETE